MCMGTPVLCEQTVREQVARPGRRMRRACTGILVQYARTFSVGRGSAGNRRRAGRTRVAASILAGQYCCAGFKRGGRMSRARAA